MKHILLFLSLFIASQIYGQETWNACNSTVTIIPPPSYDSTFVLSAPSRAALAKGMANWTPSTSGGASYLVYTALLTQSGTDAPVATVLENTLGGTPTFSYETLGTFHMTLSNAFTAGKTYVNALNANYSNGNILSDGQRISASVIELTSFDVGSSADDMWNASDPVLVEIRVYP